MKPFDYQKILFWVNILVTALVFVLLAPTVHIYSWWFPEKRDTLWLLPVGVMTLSLFLWIAASLSMPYLIQKGWLEDRRRLPRPGETARRVKLYKTLMPVVIFLFHSLLILGLAVSIVTFMRGDSLERLLTEVALGH